MDGPANIRLQIESNTLFLSGVRELVYHIASRIGFSDEHCGQMALATDEAICNVIRHGYGRAADRPIWISLRCLGGIATPETHGTYPTTGLEITIEDEARQVDLSQIKSRDLDEIRPGGLGVHIIQQVMDDVRYEHREDLGGKGMRLTMTKLRTAPAEGAAPQPAEGHAPKTEASRCSGGNNGTASSNPVPNTSVPNSSIQGSAANCPAGGQQRPAKEHGR